MKNVNEMDTPLRSIRTLLQLILVILLLRIGMDFTPIGKSDAGVLIGLISFGSSISLIGWMVISRFVSCFSGLADSESSKNDLPRTRPKN